MTRIYRQGRADFSLKASLTLLGFILVLATATPSWAAPCPGALKIPGWTPKGKIQEFSPRTLYNYINGGADLYLKYDFKDLKVTEYRNREQAVIVEMYRHRTPHQAFRIYSQERPGNTRFLALGAQGYIEEMFLNFTSGNYYVKLSCDNAGPDKEKVLLLFARNILKNLGSPGLLPAILSAFPEEGKKKDMEKFVSKDFLGYSFFNSGFTAHYEVSGKKFQLFIIESDGTTDAAGMVSKYFQQVGGAGENISEGSYQLKDPYHGPIDLVWKGKYIWGVLNLDDPILRAKYMQLLGEQMAER